MPRKRKTSQRASVRHVARDARRLVTVDVQADRHHTPVTLGEMDGAIVRLRPVEWIDPEVLADLAERAKEMGAIAVKVLPCPPKGEVVVAATKQIRRTLRQVVSEMVDEAKGVDTDALRDMVEQVMSDEGL